MSEVNDQSKEKGSEVNGSLPAGGHPTRRAFLRAAGVATAGLALPGWARSSAYALAPPRVIGANDRIGVGAIGCGGMGMTHVRSFLDQAKKSEENLQVVAVCDIYEPRKNQARSLTGGALHHDYRKLLEAKEVDVVMIATPEHLHAQQATDAMEAGKDLYLEKPICRHMEEAKKIYDVATRTGRIVQVGSQWTQEEKWTKAGEMIKGGKIGKPVWSQTSYCRNSMEGEWNYGIDNDASPDNLDWNAFLGTAPKRPFDKDRFFRWRKYWDYSAGITSDLFPHVMHTLFLALALDFPTRHTMLVAGCTANELGLETVIRGHKANMYLGGNQVVVRPERTFAEEVEESREGTADIGDPMRAHEKDFFRSVRSRKQPRCNIELAYKVHVTVGLAELAYRKNKMMQFDAKTKAFTAV